MLTIPPSTKLSFASAVDLRQGFDGLANLVRCQLDAEGADRTSKAHLWAGIGDAESVTDSARSNGGAIGGVAAGPLAPRP